MLGQDLTARLQARHEVIPLTRADADITDADGITGAIRRASPEAVVHTAALTAVDRCESERDLAFRVNGDGTRNIALACGDLKIPLLYLSTDYVFDGKKKEPYVETDATHPINVYGESKLEGERQVSRLLEHYWIVRTSWLFGLHGRNFVRAIVDQANSGVTLRVVSDQFGSPTYTEDLASGIGTILERGGPGIYHVCNQGFCSWFDFSQEILRQIGMDPSTVVPILTAEANRPARRPSSSCLANTRLVAEGLPSLSSWQDALRRYLLRSIEAK
jgi:dTDP-4-dehydrorhamnose reductase